jgi:hypothetical protein
MPGVPLRRRQPMSEQFVAVPGSKAAHVSGARLCGDT